MLRNGYELIPTTAPPWSSAESHPHKKLKMGGLPKRRWWIVCFLIFVD